MLLAGPSGEDFTQRWHLFSRNSARDGGMEGGENKDIYDSRHGQSMVLCWGGTDGGKGLWGWLVGFKKFMFFSDKEQV